MGSFFFLRYALVSLAFAGWLVYQRLARKKSWRELRTDTIAVAFFVGVWIALSCWLLS